MMEKPNPQIAFDVRAKTADYLMEIIQDRGITQKEMLEVTGLTKEVLGKILTAGNYDFTDLLLILQALEIHITFEAQLNEFKVPDTQLN